MTLAGAVCLTVPKHAMQMMFTCFSMVLSLTIFAYILGEISNLVMDQDAELVKTRSQVQLLAWVPLRVLVHATLLLCISSL